MAGGDRNFDLKNVLKHHLDTDRTPQKTQDILMRLAEFDTHLPNGKTTVGRDTELWNSYEEGSVIELERDIRLESGEKLSFIWGIQNMDTEGDTFVLFARSLDLAIKDRDNDIYKQPISFFYKKGAWHQKESRDRAPHFCARTTRDDNAAFGLCRAAILHLEKRLSENPEHFEQAFLDLLVAITNGTFTYTSTTNP
jgi:hypothetical protein